ncbi:RNA polymerase sigma factor [Sphingorhabdus pulchriflava]|uniref:RNA polymerase sigma factor n=1 Tax=Sphingorhabdus pulchriflava TaxID=2292257 RepID=UPI0015F1A3D6|nr:RNA polymerase sigma factor [Sphingorhabdus pulchriflava]
MAQAQEDQDRLFAQATAQFGAALGRIVNAYEANAERKVDLAQDIQIALWRSFAAYKGDCSLKTWVYRVAHNRATTHMMHQKRIAASRHCNIEDFEFESVDPNPETIVGEQRALTAIRKIVDALHPPDRQIMLLYLEDLSGAEIAEVAGVASATVATKISRFKSLLARQFKVGGEEV